MTNVGQMKRSRNALNVVPLILMLCRKVKTIKHGSVRINIVHFPIPYFCSAVPTTDISNKFSACVLYIYIIWSMSSKGESGDWLLWTRTSRRSHTLIM